MRGLGRVAVVDISADIVLSTQYFSDPIGATEERRVANMLKNIRTKLHLQLL